MLKSLLVVLDLDETLVHATNEPLDRPCDFRCHGYSVYRRPGLNNFLDGLRARFDTAATSSACPSTAGSL